MTTPNFIYLSVQCLKNETIVQTFLVFAGFLTGLSFPVQWTNRLQGSRHCFFIFSVNMTIICVHMSLGYMLTSIKHCTPRIIFLAEADLNLRGQMSL